MTALSRAKGVVYVLVRDPAVAKPFYSETLGLTEVGQDDYATAYDLNGIQLRLTKVGDHVPSPHPVLGWDVSDIRATSRDLAAKGVKFNIYPGFDMDELGIWTSPDGASKCNWFNDPDGNVLMMSQG